MLLHGVRTRVSNVMAAVHNRLIFGGQSLFDKDGWGPNFTVRTCKMRDYRGPLFPEPLHPKDTVVSQSAVASTCNQARIAWSKRQFALAENLYRSALKKDTSNSDVLFELAQLLWLVGRKAEAKEMLSRARALRPNQYQTIVSLVEIDRPRNANLALQLLKIQPQAPMPVYLEAMRRL
jgi:tetratricopeptide (TPR) repeat protein